MPVKLSFEIFNELVIKETGDEYTLIPNQEYKGAHKPLKIIHNKCGHDYKVSYTKFRDGDRCPKCAGNIPPTPEEFREEIFNLTNGEYEVLGDYVNNKTEIEFFHNLCGEPFSVTPKQFKGVGKKKPNRCPYCSGYKLSQRMVNTLIKNLSNDEYEVIGEYISYNEPFKVRHRKCENEYSVTVTNFKAGCRCPKCNTFNNVSNLEKEVSSFIESFYSKEISLSNRKILKNSKQIDIYCPEDKIAIEVDGLYWHSDNQKLFEPKDKNYHLNKTLECQEKDIRLIHIFEDEWLYKKDIVKSKLKHILKCNELPKIRASKCFITELESSIKDQFLEENHIQGKDKAFIKLGLWYPINDEEDRLVAVMTFCKPRKSLGQSKSNKKQYDYELSRFASDIEFRVYGAFDKLFNYFKENYEWKSIITYADRRWSVGGVYEKTGFELDHISNPNYWYCRWNERYHRYGFRKSELKKKFPEYYDDNLTEFEIMEKVPNFAKIWDCGNLVYKYNK